MKKSRINKVILFSIIGIVLLYVTSQLLGAKSFYQIPDQAMTKKNFHGKCRWERDGVEIPFFSHVRSSIFKPGKRQIHEYYNEVLQKKQAILKELQASGLSGRGGAGFPFARKLHICKDQDSSTKYVLCNGEEGDTGAFSDKYLFEYQPHLVLAGMFAAGICIGAQSGVLYVSDEYATAVEILKTSIAEFEKTQVG